MAAENYSRWVAVMTVVVMVVKKLIAEMKVAEINDRCFRWFFFRSFSLFCIKKLIRSSAGAFFISYFAILFLPILSSLSSELTIVILP